MSWLAHLLRRKRQPENGFFVQCTQCGRKWLGFEGYEKHDCEALKEAPKEWYGGKLIVGEEPKEWATEITKEADAMEKAMKEDGLLDKRDTPDATFVSHEEAWKETDIVEKLTGGLRYPDEYTREEIDEHFNALLDLIEYAVPEKVCTNANEYRTVNLKEQLKTIRKRFSPS